MISRLRTSLPLVALACALGASGAALAQPDVVAVEVATTTSAAAPAPTASVQVAPQVTVSSIPGDPLDSHFKTDDRNGDGAIERDEAGADPGLSKAFASFDKDHNGQLSLAEYKAWRDWK